MPWSPWRTALAGVAAGALAIALIPSGSFFVAPVDDPAAEAGEGGRWACPMMDFIGQRPGLCPVCGMTLERVTAGELTREQRRRMGVRTVTATSATATAVVRAYGTAAYDERHSRAVIARVGGRIVARHESTYGCCQEVAEGDPIVDLYSPEAFQAQVELAAALRSGDAALIRSLRERFARWHLSHVAEAVAAGAEPSDTVTIVSPFAGQAWLEEGSLADQALMVGTEVAPGAPLLKLVDAKRLVLVVHVPETSAHLLRVGQPVRLASDDLGELPDIQASIGRVANELNPSLRSREVRIYLADGRRRILPGALVQARIQGALGPDLFPADPADPATWGRFVQLPKRAVLSTGVRHVAWRLAERRADGSIRFEPVTLALGPRLEDPDGEDRYVIRSGLGAGDEVAAEGAFLIDSQAQLAGSVSLLFPDGAVRSP